MLMVIVIIWGLTTITIIMTIIVQTMKLIMVTIEHISVHNTNGCKRQMPCRISKRFEAARSAAEESSIFTYKYTYIYIYVCVYVFTIRFFLAHAVESL